jgi:hypothetical protein
MERPTMKENLKGYSLQEAHKLYTDCPELYRHIVKLDEYIDDLEDKLNNLVIADVVVPKGTLKTNKGKCPCKMPFSQTWCEEHERWT